MATVAAMVPPPPTEILQIDEQTTGYRWILSDSERAHIVSLLNTTPENVALRGNIMTQERRVCRGCGKHSGLDDLVHNAMVLNIHSAGFMLDVLNKGPKNDSPAHEVTCSNCGMRHEGEFLWIPSDPWF